MPPASSDSTVIVTSPRQRITAADAPREHHLVVLRGDQPGRRLALGMQPLRVGRHPDNPLALRDPRVSSRHCEITAHGREADAWVRDLGSTNGSFVDGHRIEGLARWPVGSVLQVGDTVLKHEATWAEEHRHAQALDEELAQAVRYVQALLPTRLTDGPVRSDWCYQPSARLGGDAFGHQWLDDGALLLYLVDVSGHGAGAAMHGVSVMNVLRQQALPDTDLHDPAAVLQRLNRMFQMDSHGGMVFTMWCGVYQPATRVLRHAAGGHHPASLVAAGQATPLRTRHLPLGALPDVRYTAAEVTVPAGARLYVYSDGVFEFDTADGGDFGLQGLLPLLLQHAAASPASGPLPDAETLYRAVRQRARPGPLDDDFSLLVLTFD